MALVVDLFQRWISEWTREVTVNGSEGEGGHVAQGLWFLQNLAFCSCHRNATGWSKEVCWPTEDASNTLTLQVIGATLAKFGWFGGLEGQGRAEWGRGGRRRGEAVGGPWKGVKPGASN